MGLRRNFPAAQIHFAVGRWSRAVLEGHSDIDILLDTGIQALPTKSWWGVWRFAQVLRAGKYDLAISLVRSARMSLALKLSGIRWRAGIDSDGRGFGYHFRARTHPQSPRHECEIYLDVLRAVGLDTEGCRVQIPLQAKAAKTLEEKMSALAPKAPYFVLHPGGGANPGMNLDTKRWPIARYFALAERLCHRWRERPVWIVGQDEGHLLANLPPSLREESLKFVGELSFAEVAQLAAGARVYIGNDSGLTHLAAASGARVVAIFGPSDPRRYGPRGPACLSIYRAVPHRPQENWMKAARAWDWESLGVTVDEVEDSILSFAG